MRTRSLAGALVLAAGFCLALPVSAHAQIFDKLKDAAEDAVTRETGRQVERLLRDAIRCALDDPVCPQQAEREGKETIYVDESGEVITDDEGVPITDREAARERAGVGAEGAEESDGAVPGEGVWANYDFVPGDEILYYDDYGLDRIGDFPRRMNFVRGNWEVVEWQGRRLLRNTGNVHSAVEIPLPQELGQRFTVELEVFMPHASNGLSVSTYSPVADGRDIRSVEGNYFHVGAGGSGIRTNVRGSVEAHTHMTSFWEELVPIRIMVDGRYAKVYVGEERVGNVPNAELRRSGTVYLEARGTSPNNPIYVGPVRVAAGGPDLYDDLLDDGRAVTRGILFAVNSHRIRPESTPTLQALGRMLTEHPDLRLRVEGHTDGDGEEAHNQDLSERRAASVKAFLVSKHSIDGSRLETAGYGESQPVADNVSSEGKQKNRRVELVRLEG